MTNSIILQNFFDILDLVWKINSLHNTHFELNLGFIFESSLIYFYDRNVHVEYTVFLNDFFYQVKPSLQYLLENPQRIEFILESHKGHEDFVFNEFVGNLAALHFISPKVFP